MRALASRLRSASLLVVLIVPLGFLLATAAGFGQDLQKGKHGEADKDAAKHEHAVGHDQPDADVKHEPTAMEHVVDPSSGVWHLFESIEPQHVHLPEIFGFQITKFMVLEV